LGGREKSAAVGDETGGWFSDSGSGSFDCAASPPEFGCAFLPDVPAPTQPAIVKAMSELKRMLRAVIVVASIGVHGGNASTVSTLQVAVPIFMKSAALWRERSFTYTNEVRCSDRCALVAPESADDFRGAGKKGA
jgi:hypothetical protein